MFIGANAQYNVNIHASSLDKTVNGSPISGMVVSKDGGDVVEVTNASGNTTMSNVGGSMNIKISHPDYMQFTQTFDIHSDTTLWLATPARIDSRWSGNTLDVTKYKALFQTANGDYDPAQWKNFPSKINVQYVNATPSDIDKATTFLTQLKNMTGYDLFNVTTGNIDTMYTVYFNSNTFVSAIATDANGLIIRGYSKLMNLPDVKSFGHEFLQAEDIGAMVQPVAYPSIGDPDNATMTDLNITDAHHIGVTFDQHYRKNANKQNLFLGNIQNYVALGNVDIGSIVNPFNNELVDSVFDIISNKDSNSIYYDYKVCTDAAGSNIVLQQTTDRPRLHVVLNSGKTYYLFERQRNNTSTGTWEHIKVNTKSPGVIMPDSVKVTNFPDGAKNLETPLYVEVSYDPNSTQNGIQLYNLNNVLLLDTLFTGNSVNIPEAKAHQKYKVYSYGKNVNGIGPITGPENIEMINHAPTASKPIYPLETDTVYSNQNTTLEGTSATDPDGDIVNYIFIIEGDGVNKTINTGTDTICNIAAGTFQPQKIYTWKIGTTDGIDTTYSTTGTFKPTITSTTVIENKNIEDIIIFPVPCKDHITVKDDNINTETIKMYNSIGQIVLNTTKNNTEETYNTTGLKPGIYFMNVDDKYTKKIIKE